MFSEHYRALKQCCVVNVETEHGMRLIKAKHRDLKQAVAGVARERGESSCYRNVRACMIHRDYVTS